MDTVAVLYADIDSVYKVLDGTDVYDVDRDARNYRGGYPVVAHPPCRLWSRLRVFSSADIRERDLAFHALENVRMWGGVLEHPAGSSFWRIAGLPHGSGRDRWGGWHLEIPQKWFGHRAEKNTWLYVCGIEPSELPVIPISFCSPDFLIGCTSRFQKELPKKERNRTPVDFALFLLSIARSAGGKYRFHLAS